MERLKCKACGSHAMTPMEVAVEHEDEHHNLLGGDQESRFYTCQVCGDNWLSVKETDRQGACTVTFIHQMGMSPVLKRTAHVQTPVLVNKDMMDDWDYYLDDEEVGEDRWQQRLDKRRTLLKSICTN